MLTRLKQFVARVLDVQPTEPEEGVFVSSSRRDLEVEGIGHLTPAKLAEVLREGSQGQLARMAALFDRIEQDPHIMAVYGKRKRTAVRTFLANVQVTPADDSAQAKTVAEFCEAALLGVHDLGPSLFDLLDAIGRGFSVSQIVWAQRDGWVPASLRWWPQREFLLDRDDPEQLRVRTDEELAHGEPLAPWQWLVHRYKARSGHPGESQLLRGLAWAFLFKQAAWRDELIYSEGYGMPRRTGFYPRGASDPERNAVRRAVLQLGRDAAAVLPEGARVELIEAKGGGKGSLPFEVIIARSDRYASKLLLGQTLTTEEGSSGARAMAETHKDVEEELIEGDTQALVRTVREQLIVPIAGFNFGWDAPVPTLELPVEQEDNRAAAVQVTAALAGLGLPLSVENLRSKYDEPAPTSDEDTLIVTRGAASQGAQS